MNKSPRLALIVTIAALAACTDASAPPTGAVIPPVRVAVNVGVPGRYMVTLRDDAATSSTVGVLASRLAAEHHETLTHV